MTSDFASDRSIPKRSRIALSTKTKKQVRELVGKCEYCDRVCPPDELEVFLLGMLSRSPHRPDDNPAPVCSSLHRALPRGRGGDHPETGVAIKIAKRPDKLKKSLRSLLQKHDRTYEGENVRETHDPNRFTVGAFLKKNPDANRK